MEKPEKHYFYQVINVNITVISCVDSIYLLIWDMGYVENGTSTLVFFPKTHKPSLIMRNPS